MRALVLCACLAVVAWEGRSEDEVGQENGVFILTEANFDAFLEEHPTTLVEFYAPWFLKTPVHFPRAM